MLLCVRVLLFSVDDSDMLADRHRSTTWLLSIPQSAGSGKASGVTRLSCSQGEGNCANRKRDSSRKEFVVICHARHYLSDS